MMEPVNSSDFSETGTNNDDRLQEILLKELDKEIAYKMGAVSEISKRIETCKDNLDRLRKEAVAKFFMGFHQVDESSEQPSIHPSIKKLVGKRPAPSSALDRFMKSNICQWKRETRKKFFKSHHQKNRLPASKDYSAVPGSSNSDSSLKPCYVPPDIPGNPQENSTLRGNTKKMHMRVLVGNVAKEVQHMSDDSASHKWMVYVRSAPGSLSLERHVSKVRFYLHPSYKPHDVITVPNPPFTLNRRGWGEFSMRIQLYFENPWNKTVDIIHNLKFGGTRSGLHSRSAETFADLWIYPGSGSVKSELSTEADASEILWLASDMLSEVVPSFSTEVTCHKCRLTSSSADSYCCPCLSESSSEESTADHPISFRHSQPISQDSDFTDSNDSFSDARFLGQFDISRKVEKFCQESRNNIKQESDPGISNVNRNEIPVQKQIDTSYCQGFYIGCSRSLIVNDKEKNTLRNPNHTEIKCESSSKLEPELLRNIANFNSPNSFGIISQSSSLDFELEPSDILDALEIKQEVKEVDVCDSDESTNKINSFSFKTSKTAEEAILEEDIIKTEVVYNKEDNIKKDVVNSIEDIIETEVVYNEEDIIETEVVYNEEDIIKTEVVKSKEGIFETEVVYNEEDIIETEVVNNQEDIIETEVVYDHGDIGGTEFMNDDLYTSKTTHNYQISSDSSNTNADNLVFLSQNSFSMDEIPVNDFSGNILEEILVEIPESGQNSNGFHVGTTNSKPNNLCNDSKPISPLKSTDLEKETKLVPNCIVKKVPDPSVIKNLTQVPPSGNVSCNTNKVSDNFLDKSQTQDTPCGNVIGNTKEISEPLFNKKFTQVSSSGNIFNTFNNPKTSENFDQDINSISKGKEKAIRTFPVVLNVNDKLKSDKIIKLPKVNEKYSIIPQKSFLLQPKTPVLINVVSNKIVNGNGLKKLPICNVVPKKVIITSQSLLKPNVTETTFKPVPLLQKKISLLKPVLQRKSQLQTSLRNPLSLLKPTLQISQNQLKSSDLSHLVLVKREEKNRTTAKPLGNIKSTSTVYNVPVPQHTLPSSSLQTCVEKSNVILKNVGVKPEQKVSLIKSKVNHNLPYVQNNVSVHIVKPSMENIQNQKEPVISLKSVNAIIPKNPRLFNQPCPNVKELSRHPTFTANIDSALKSKQNKLDKLLLSDLIKILNISSECISLKTFSEYLSGSDSDLNCVLSSNSLHCNLSKTHKVFEPHSSLGKKTILVVNKDTLSSVANKQVLYYLEQLRLLVNTSCQFEDPEYCVRWLTRGLPLVHSDASLLSFKMVHPYCAPSLETYCSWPKTKRVANEWLRSKTVARFLKLVKAKGSPIRSLWSTHTIYRWCQTHGYSPGCSLEGFNESSSRSEGFIQKCYKKTEPVKVMEWMSSPSLKANCEDQEVDVVGMDLKEPLRRAAEKRWEEVDEGKRLLCGQPWVRDLGEHTRLGAERVGARLGLECLVPGAAPEALSTTLLSLLTATFAEDLLRRSLSATSLRGGSCIAPADVCQAICERREFDLFTKQGLQVNSQSKDHLNKRATPEKPP